MSEIIDFFEISIGSCKLCNLRFFLQISWCAWIWLPYINPILLKIDIYVRYTMMLVWSNWILWKHYWYLQIYATYDFCKYICVHVRTHDWSTYPILLKVVRKMYVLRCRMSEILDFFKITTDSCNIIKFIQGITIFIMIVKN